MLRKIGVSVGFFSELGPAGVEGVVFVLRGVQFEEGLLEGGGVGGYFGVLYAVAGGVRGGRRTLLLAASMAANSRASR